jgi:hypothetical protein
MHFLLGNLRMENSDYESAIQLFEHARGQLRDHTSRGLLVISLVSFPTAILHRIEIGAIYNRYLDGNLIISASQFTDISVKPCMRRVVQRRRVALFWRW